MSWGAGNRPPAANASWLTLAPHMRIETYYPQHGQGAAHGAALMSCLSQLGHDTLGHDLCCASDETMDRGTDLGIFYACGGGQGDVMRRALEAGKPCIVLELGYLGNRYEHVGISLLLKGDKTHNNNGAFLLGERKPADRLEALGIVVEEAQQTPGLGRGLVLGQVNGDTQLGGVDVERWCREATSALCSCGYDVTFRPHPGLIKPNMILEDAVRRSNLVMAYNSTALVECIRLGVPFSCADGCQYEAMGTDDFMKPAACSLEARRQFLANLAYCQYNAQEFGNGSAWAHILELLLLRGVTCR